MTSPDVYLPEAAKIIARIDESPSIFTLETQFIEQRARSGFSPGQFSMLYLYGVGEIAISIAQDPAITTSLRHTIRAVGRSSRALQQLNVGDEIGIRGPYGQGWPLDKARGKDIIIVTGGLGCAPSLSLINYIVARRSEFGHLTILQGVKHSDDFIFKKQYAEWQSYPNVRIVLAANQAGPTWPFATGYVTDMIEDIRLQPHQSIAMLCGPESMMHAATQALLKKNVPEHEIYLSMERNMACAIGHCGHCQYGGLFVCQDGPVFAYPRIKALFCEKGF